MRTVRLGFAGIRKLIAEEMSKREGMDISVRDVRFDVSGDGVVMGVEVCGQPFGRVSVEELEAERQAPPPPPPQRVHPGWAQHGKGRTMGGKRICPECSTRPLDENGKCAYCDRED